MKRYCFAGKFVGQIKMVTRHCLQKNFKHMLKYCKAFVKIFLDNQKLGLKVVFPMVQST